MTEDAFGSDVLDLLSIAREVEIETSRAPDAPIHRTVIWIVVDDASRVFVRSVRGSRGRWYRELLAHPFGAVVARERRIPVHAVVADDAPSVEACSLALAAKYKTARASLAAMLREDVLDTTLELIPSPRG